MKQKTNIFLHWKTTHCTNVKIFMWSINWGPREGWPLVTRVHGSTSFLRFFKELTHKRSALLVGCIKERDLQCLLANIKEIFVQVTLLSILVSLTLSLNWVPSNINYYPFFYSRFMFFFF